MSTRVSPRLARICQTDCNNLVTTEVSCPLCNNPTDVHPEARETEGYCQGCAEGPFLIDELHLVTWSEDPYVQSEDGDLYYLCPQCQRIRDDRKEEIVQDLQ